MNTPDKRLANEDRRRVACPVADGSAAGSADAAGMSRATSSEWQPRRSRKTTISGIANAPTQQA